MSQDQRVTLSQLMEGALNSGSTSGVGFTAGFNRNDKLIDNAIVIFPKVFTNESNCYNSLSGIFNALRDGLYVFHIHGLSEKGNCFKLDLYRNNEYLISALANQSSDNVSSGNSITLKLNLNDNVYVRASGNGLLYGTANEVYATFTGYMINASD